MKKYLLFCFTIFIPEIPLLTQYIRVMYELVITFFLIYEFKISVYRINRLTVV